MSSALFIFIQQNPILFAGIFGIIPAIVWLWFWLKEDIHPEPTKLIIFCFLLGMLSVFVALPLQHFAQNITDNVIILFFLWAIIEEILKFSAAWIGGIHTSADDEPIDPIIYMIVAALGFVAMENTLFLIDPLISGNLGDTFITGSLRFIGATLLHVISSSTIGVFLALSFNKARIWKIVYGISGGLVAVVLHVLFNLSIMNNVSGNIFLIFGLIWAGLIFLMLLLEKIKSVQAPIYK